MNNWQAPQRPNSYAEDSLINAILDGTFPPGSTLPGERDLAAQLGITRPTLREALQRLARDGWITVKHGKPTAVNNIWEDGGLNVLSGLVKHGQHLPPGFITHLLEIRLDMAPTYTRQAVARAQPELVNHLNGYANLADNPLAFARFDWQLHRQLTITCGNPIYALILNGFNDFYEELAQLYFAQAEARSASRRYYSQLATAVAHKDADFAWSLTVATMEKSIELWQSSPGYRGGSS